MKPSIKLSIFSIVLFTLNSCCFGDLPVIGCVSPRSKPSIPFKELLDVSNGLLIVKDETYSFNFEYKKNSSAGLFAGECCGHFRSYNKKLPKDFIVDKIWLLYPNFRNRGDVVIENTFYENKNGVFSFSIENIVSSPEKVILRIKNNSETFFVIGHLRIEIIR